MPTVLVGLGNPGDQYKLTRHNAGFLAIDKIVTSLGLSWETNKKFQAEICKNEQYIFIKPQTFMNNSGQVVRAILSYYKLLPQKFLIFKESNADLSDELIVIHDDLDIELGKFKKSVDSRAAGHNGVQSIINHLKTKNFTRLRIGIKTKNLEKIPGVKFVLQRLPEEELTIINQTINDIIINKQFAAR
ncbi:aminoacyl-tRNA hydrolase [Candidatus Parcubacteria bacterium]|nr:aminoacyl-tRNA hydrolase [Patescibacteria group bacterium]MBU4309646.1 aminoacyl-tRNA hydrolase [Patescibacteria group bacterium]MBU4432032.1 aminoacyl-tRNA hydrolase [Patescibacteria group bacterium]MBU4577966.1 aminoacyl-tRNA hydrolase [Patescibacteria group bacterium]MCG2696525.1 aminoacyl-tRNA hydrolase [Candidatus Parcubacteria bacterium]